MLLSILIVNWKTRDHLSQCLASIQAHLPSFPTETIVVENDSGDGSAEMVRESFPWVTLIQNSSNLGYAEGNNSAFRASSGTFVLTLNPDTEIVDNCLEMAVELMESRPEIGVLAAQLIGADGEVQRSVRGFPSLGNVLGASLGLGTNYLQPGFDYHKEQACDQPMGTFLLYRRSLLSDPMFDPEFPIFFNEVDLLRRLTDQGAQVWFSPQIKLKHWGGMSTRQVRKAMIWESHRSLIRYLRKHTRGFERIWLGPASLIILAGAYVRARGWSEGFRPNRHNL